ncbi:GntR family transcriptional regulator [Blastococcus sp. SYSU DS0619]
MTTLLPPTVPAVTKVEAAAATLREAIRSGRLLPGARLITRDLADELGMSLTPVREALQLLRAEGLVEHRPHRGTVVSDHSRERAEEVYRLRSVLEPMAAGLAARRADAEDLAAVEGLLGDLTAAIEQGRAGDVPVLNAALHRRIYAASRSPLLLEFIDRLWNGVPYQTISLVDRVAESAAEHERIVAALRRRDAGAVEAELRAHIAAGAAAALASLPPRSPG